MDESGSGVLTAVLLKPLVAADGASSEVAEGRDIPADRLVRIGVEELHAEAGRGVAVPAKKDWLEPNRMVHARRGERVEPRSPIARPVGKVRDPDPGVCNPRRKKKEPAR